MNLLRALGIGVRPAPPPPENRRVRAKLPEVNAFVDLLVGTNRTRVSVAIDAVDSNEIITRHVAGLAAGMAADFLYTNSLGKFRFVTVCTQAGSKKAHFQLPEAVKTLEAFGNRRAQPRVPWIIPVQWRYAPDGEGFGDFLDASMMDVSRGGASLVVGRELKPGTQVEVRFIIESKDQPLTEIGQVVRAAKIETSDRNSAGIRFLAVDPEDERMLDEFIVERQQLRRSRGIV